MIGRLLQPWRSGRLWPTVVHGVLDLPVGFAVSLPTIVLFSTALASALAFPIAAVAVWLLLLWARVAGRIERSRARALLDLDLPDPVAPLPEGSLWRRTRAFALSAPRWKHVGHGLLRFPLGALITVAVVAAWSGALFLLGLPAYVSTLPQETAQFGLFGASLPEAFGLSFIGAVGLVVVAPWVTVGAGRLDAWFVSSLLGPPRGRELVERAERAESGRAAAVGAAEAERRRIERDLHDGAQQRLVALAVDLGSARERFDSDPEGARALVAEAHEEAKAALREIRDLARGIHPAILEDRGLDAALSAVVARSPVPVRLTVDLGRRLPDAVESTAYFVVSEALTNVARHASATTAHVAIATSGDRLLVEIRDDGVGGADPALGSGLAGLRDRVTALGGTLDLLSPRGGPTTVLVEIPCAS